MAGKVLFVDDECMSLKTEHTITNALIKIGDAEEKTNAGIYSFTSSFEDAVRTIRKAGNGEDYSWFFIDRNLEGFDDIKNIKNGKISSVKIDDIEFNEEFFNCFEKFEGDYLYFLLRQAGVPVEKICFLTANDINSQKEDSGLRATPFLSEAEKPACIVKENKRGNACAGEDDPDSQSGEDEKELCEKINKTPQVQTRFKYLEIFDNQKINQLFEKTSFLNDFLDLLVKIEVGGIPEYADGTTLRNMIEFIMREQFNLFNQTVRNILNTPQNGYSINIQNSFWMKPKYKYDGSPLRNIEKSNWMWSHVMFYKKLPLGQTDLSSFYRNQKWGYTADASLLAKDASLLAKDIVALSKNAISQLTKDDNEILWQMFSDNIKRIALPGDEQALLKYLNQYFPVRKWTYDEAKDILKDKENEFFICCMNSIASSKVSEHADYPPKYIFSYIDNIYTVTSEWSAHGKNQQTTNELSRDGWKALVYGMIQILQWFAKEHPNIP